MSEKDINQEHETQVAKIDDLPVSQAEQDEVKGGPVLGAATLVRFNTATPSTSY